MSGVLFVLFVLVVCLPVYFILRQGTHRYPVAWAALIGALSAAAATAVTLLGVRIWWAITVPGGGYLGFAPPAWILLDNIVFGALFGLVFFTLWKTVSALMRMSKRYSIFNRTGP